MYRVDYVFHFFPLIRKYKKKWYKIIRNIIWILSRRVLRFGKRISKYIAECWYSIVGAIIVALFIIVVGFRMGKYVKVADAIWDLRIFLSSSIFIVVFSNIIKSETQRHESLIKQYYLYQEFMWNTENNINRLLGMLSKRYTGQILMTEEGWYTFKIALACKDEEFFDVPLEWDTKPEYFDKKSYVKHILNEEIETLQCVKAYVENHLLVNNEIDSCVRYCTEHTQYIKGLLFALEDMPEQDIYTYLEKWIEEIGDKCFLICAKLRKPWRLEIDMVYMRELRAYDSIYKFTEETFTKVNADLKRRGMCCRIKWVDEHKGIIEIEESMRKQMYVDREKQYIGYLLKKYGCTNIFYESELGFVVDGL